MNLKKMAIDAAVLKAITEALKMAGRRHRRPAARGLRGLGPKVSKTVEGFGVTAGKTVEGLTATAGKTMEGLSATAEKTVEGISSTVGKTLEGIGTSAGMAVGALSEAVEKTVETTVSKTKDMTVGRVGEMRVQRSMAKLAKRRQKVRKQRMDKIGMWFGFGLVIAFLYWWESRRDKTLSEVAGQAARTLRSTQETLTRTVQQVASTDALQNVKETVTRAAQDIGDRASEQASRLAGDVKTRFGSDRNMEAEGNGRSEVSAPGELRGPSGPAISNGMKVVGFDGVDVGRVQEVEGDSFILDRPKGSDLRVPMTAVARVEGTVAYLRVSANRVVQQGWESTGSS